jgi:hypothetical protein
MDHHLTVIPAYQVSHSESDDDIDSSVPSQPDLERREQDLSRTNMQ